MSHTMMSNLTHRKLVKNEIEFERPPPSTPDSLIPKSIEPKKICFTYKSYDRLKKMLRFRDHARKQIVSGISSRPWNRIGFRFGSCSLMDGRTRLSGSPVESTKKMFTEQQKKEELEIEVIVLNKLISHEEKMREYLEELHNYKDKSALSISNFLPPKMKEIITELTTVENEIARLENQIKLLQHHKDDINVHKNTYNEWGHRRSLEDHLGVSPLPPNSHMSSMSNENVASTTIDTKACISLTRPSKRDYHRTSVLTKICSKKTCLKKEEKDCYEKQSKKEM